MSITKTLFGAVRSVASTCALAAGRPRTRIHRRRHGRGRVLFRIGKPDHEAFVVNVRGQPEEKTWTYFPDPRDPQTLTIITLQAGVVAKIERKIAR